jgi:hypothetical protein
MTNKLLKDPKSLANQPEVFVEMLEFVLKEDVKALEVGDYEFWSEVGVWFLVLNKCTGLQRSALGSRMFNPERVPEFRPFLTSLAPNCPLITELILKDSVRGSLTLATIGNSCHQLRTLDITGSIINCSDLVHLCVQSTTNVVSEEDLERAYEQQFDHLCQTLDML